MPPGSRSLSRCAPPPAPPPYSPAAGQLAEAPGTLLLPRREGLGGADPAMTGLSPLKTRSFSVPLPVPRRLGHILCLKKNAPGKSGASSLRKSEGEGLLVGMQPTDEAQLRPRFPAAHLQPGLSTKPVALLRGQWPGIGVIYKGMLDVWRLLNECPWRPGPALDKMDPALPCLPPWLLSLHCFFLNQRKRRF